MSLKPLVSICCVTYNHEKYIKQALDSFLMQKADFQFEILIHDDASTDRTAEIIREYQIEHPEIIKPILQVENQRSKLGGGMNNRFNVPRADGEYLAFCEGDDYWTDPNRLQNQIKLLSSKQTNTYCGGICQLVKDDSPIDIFIGEYPIPDGEKLSSYKFLKQNTLLVPKDLYLKMVYKYSGQIALNEFTVNNILFELGQCVYYKNVVSVYRITETGVWAGIKATKRLRIHYRDVKAMRKHLKKNWSFHALQEMVSYLMISWQELKTERSTAFFRQNFWSTLVLSVYFLLRLGFIFAIPPFLHWWSEKRKTKELFL